jgi:hypothetical protein
MVFALGAKNHAKPAARPATNRLTARAAAGKKQR